MSRRECHVVHITLCAARSGRPFTKQASTAKRFATEIAEKVCFNAIQIHSGYGYNSEYSVERVYTDQRLMTICEGTSEIQRPVIARNALSITILGGFVQTAVTVEWVVRYLAHDQCLMSVGEAVKFGRGLLVSLQCAGATSNDFDSIIT